MHSKSVDSLSLTRAGFIEYFLVATKLVHALTAIAPALFLLYYPGLVPVELRSNMLGLLLFFGALTVIMFQALDVYSDDIFSNRLRFRIMFFAWASAFCLLLFMYQGLGLFPYLSSKLVIFWFTGSLLLFGVQRLLVLRLYRAWMKRGMYLQRTVILGFTESGMHLAEYLVRNHDIRSGIIGFIDDRSERVPENYNSLPLLGNTKDLEKLIRQEQVDQVLVALPWFAEGRIGAIVHRLRQLPVNVLLVPDMAAFRHAHNRIVDVSGIPMFNASELPLRGWSPLIKRCEDLVLASIALVLFAPLMALVALAIRLDSKGPVLFRQKRYGYNNRLIWVFKFRSMYTERTDANAERQTTRDDDRITRVGRFIRKTSIDELPQLFNVLAGSMSMVGPRPHATATKAAGIPFEEAVSEYSSRHRVKPGITGWAQINGYRGETDTLHKIKKRVEYDLEYIAKWSVWFDLYILFRTVPAVLLTKEVYWMNAVAPLIPCIVSGGSGTRLWPVSRESMPKPFMRLADDQSLLQKTFLRIAGLPDVARLLTVTNRDLLFRTLDDYRAVNRSGLAQDLLLEPMGRNTAPAIAAAALHVQEHFGDQAQLLILPADHLIRDEQAFAAAVAEARGLAAQGYLVTFGITPERAETGFGYIEQGAPLGNGFRVARFVEKPDQATAQSYLDSGKYLWNAGMFCFQAATVLQELERHAPEVLIAARAALADGSSLENGQCRQRELAAGAFAEAPDISVDYALMERSDKVAVVPCSIGWSDIGSWQALRELSAADENGNQVRGESVLHDVSNCYIDSPKRLVGAVGVHDLIIVDTPDALLVADAARSQDVKFVAQELKRRGHDAFRLHRTVSRPWGTYTVLEEGRRFKIKRIVVRPKASLSLQMHHHRSEHWIVVSGMALVENGEREFLLNTNESTFIPAGHSHRLSNPGIIDLVMIEVQSGEYLGEDDIVRFNDIYGRAPASDEKKA